VRASKSCLSGSCRCCRRRNRGTGAAGTRIKVGGQNFIGGSYALHDYLSRRDATPPTWAPGDVDFWLPCASHADSVSKPNRVAKEFTRGARERLGVILQTTHRGNGGEYDARYNFNMRLASPEVACVVTDVLDLDYIVDLPGWDTTWSRSRTVERLDVMARQGVLVDKVSIIGTTRRAIRQDRVASRLEPRDILRRFDIDICQVGLTLFVEPGPHPIDPDRRFPHNADSLCSGQRTYLFGRDDVEANVRARSAHCLFWTTRGCTTASSNMKRAVSPLRRGRRNTTPRLHG